MGDSLPSLAIRFAIVSTVSYFSLRWLLNALDPTRKSRIEAEKAAKALLSSLGLEEDLNLTDHEYMVAQSLVNPSDMNVTWKDVAGLDSTIKEIRETVIDPIRKRHLVANKSVLSQAPKGVLLHGPPGCGKTMIAKATAKEAAARFINLDIGNLTDKWYGESQKIAGAIFTLAKKIQPCIIFIDEIDSLLRSRSSFDHEATAMIKSQFLQWWDGLSTDQNCCIIVMGATNRPKDVDRAILRRMPSTFFIGLPSPQQRFSILTRMLDTELLSDDIDCRHISKLTDSFSGSDLREVCRTAAVARMVDTSEADSTLRPINQSDLIYAVHKIKESKIHCDEKFTSFGLD